MTPRPFRALASLRRQEPLTSRVLVPTLVAAGLVLAVLAVLLVLVWRRQERIVFQPPPPPYPAPSVRRLDFTGEDGQPLFAYVIGGGRPLVLAFHGNAEIAAWNVPWAEELARRTGSTVVLAEYRGYAGLPGRPTYAGSRADALATWRTVERELGATAEHTVLYGFSLGSAIAVELAETLAPRGLRAVVLESPFSSARAMAARFGLPGLGTVWGAISRVHFDTRERVSRLDVPLWVAHGTGDLVIPARMGKEVHAAGRRSQELLLVPGAGHNDVSERAGPAYWAWIEKAVRSVD